MAFRKKQSDLTSGELSKEFFADSSPSVPGQQEASDGTTDLIHAVTGSMTRGRGDREATGNVPGGATGVPGAESQSTDVYSLYATGKDAKEGFGPDYSRRSWFELSRDNPDVNPYVAEQQRRFGFDPRAVKVIRLAVLAALFFLLALISPSPGYNIEFSYTFSGVFTAAVNNGQELLELIGGNWHGQIMGYKICTYGIVACAGAALAITGAVYQGALKNALVSPTTLGVTSGGTMGASLFVLFAPAAALNPFAALDSSYITNNEIMDYYASLNPFDYLAMTQGRAFASLLGCFTAVGLVLLVSVIVGRGRSSNFTLIICGQVVMSLAMAVVEIIRYYLAATDPDGAKSQMVRQMQIGAINDVSTPLDFALVAIPVTIGIVVILLLRRRFNLLSFSDDEAHSMGLSPERTRWLMVGVCTFITAIIISFCGNIAFVGFSVPLIVRRYVGPDFNYLIPASAVAGTAFLLLTQTITNIDIFAMFGLSIPTSVSMLTSIIGAIVFAVVTLRQRGQRNVDWL